MGTQIDRWKENESKAILRNFDNNTWSISSFFLPIHLWMAVNSDTISSSPDRDSQSFILFSLLMLYALQTLCNLLLLTEVKLLEGNRPFS